MRVLVTYNTPVAQGDYQLCHSGVLDAVADVVAAIEKLGYHATSLPVGRNIQEEVAYIAQLDFDCIFNLCESIWGNSHLTSCFAGYLELLGAPFTGASARALTITTDKRLAKAVLTQGDISTPETWSYETLMTYAQEIPANRPPLPFPIIVKPACEDGSIGIEQNSIVSNWDELQFTLHNISTQIGSTLLIAERYIEGREFTVGFLGEQNLTVLPLAEMTFNYSTPGYKPILSYQMKRVMDSPERQAFRRICPPTLNPSMSAKIIQTAQKAYIACGLRGYGRVDVRWENTTGTPYVIDVNANPDITDGQGFPLMAQIGGKSYFQLIDEIIHDAIRNPITRYHASMSS